MRFVVATIKFLSAAVLLSTILFALVLFGRTRPQDLPWTRLDLAAPVGAFTGRKLAALTQDAPLCRALLDRAGVRYAALPPRVGPKGCGYADGVRLLPGGSRGIALVPAGLGTSCAVAAALAVWEWEVIQPAALRHFEHQVVRIDHLGSYSCRPLYSRAGAPMSEHATADAIDVADFRLDEGTRITVARDWRGSDAKAAFLREVRGGACRLFATTLSPDYNAAHRNHLHVDQAERGAKGWRACA